MSRPSFRARPIDIHQSLAIVREALDESQVVAREVTHGHQTLDAENEEVRARATAPSARKRPPVGRTCTDPVERGSRFQTNPRPSLAPRRARERAPVTRCRVFALRRRRPRSRTRSARRAIEASAEGRPDRAPARVPPGAQHDAGFRVPGFADGRFPSTARKPRPGAFERGRFRTARRHVFVSRVSFRRPAFPARLSAAETAPLTDRTSDRSRSRRCFFPA